MEENKNTGGKKPLRATMNKFKDLKDTYLKNNERNIPIADADEKHVESSENVDNETNVNTNVNEVEVENAGSNDEAMQTLLDQNKKLMKEKEELKDQLIRKAAELENARRRHIKEKQDMLEFANERLLFKMLEVLDDVNNAADAAKKSNDYDSLVQGLEMIRNKTIKLFDENGVKVMPDPAGTEFDVNFHEAMMVMPSELPEHTVVQTFQAGYTMYDKVLRHARVATSSGPQQ